MTFGVNNPDLVVGENDAAIVYSNLGIRLHSVYINAYFIIMKYHLLIKKKSTLERVRIYKLSFLSVQ